MKLSQLKIDPEFQSKIPPLQFEEEQQLEQNIIAEGRLLNPIITWIDMALLVSLALNVLSGNRSE